MTRLQPMTPSSSKETPEPQRFVCDECGRTYKAVETLNRHRKNHLDDVSYSCALCSASFKRKDLLDRHMHIHASDTRPKPRVRNQRACQRCSRMKTRCDSLSPCSRCAHGNHHCTYRDDRSRSGSLQSTDAAGESSPPDSTVGGSTRGSLDGSPLSTTSPMSESSRPTRQIDVPTRTEDWQGSFGIDTAWMTDESWPRSVPPSWPLQNGPYFDQFLHAGQTRPPTRAASMVNPYQTAWDPAGISNPPLVPGSSAHGSAPVFHDDHARVAQVSRALAYQGVALSSLHLLQGQDPAILSQRHLRSPGRVVHPRQPQHADPRFGLGRPGEGPRSS